MSYEDSFRSVGRVLVAKAGRKTRVKIPPWIPQERGWLCSADQGRTYKQDFLGRPQRSRYVHSICTVGPWLPLASTFIKVQIR
jgi:hypothetical protein